MAFFSSSYAYDGAQLRRKRSISRDRPSTGNKSSDELSLRKRSPSSSVPTGADTSDPRPPLPTPVSAGMSRPRSSAQPENAPVEPSLYEQTSTPIPFTKPIKQSPSPSFPNLVIDVSKFTSRLSPSTQTQASEKWSPSSGRPDIDSSASRAAPRVGNENLQSHDVDPWKHDPSASSRSKSHSPTRSRSASASVSTSKSTPRIESVATSKDPYALSVAPQGDILPSPSPKLISRNTSTLPTPVSPLHPRSVTRTESGTKSFDHVRPLSHSSSPFPAHDTVKSKRVAVPPLDPDNSRSPPPSASASGSGTSTPMRDAKGQEKRPRNVLRKPSVSRREPTSAPTSDSERKPKTHRPRARSGVFAAIRRNSSGGLFDLIHPPPPTANLTPAGEILVAYKESQRDVSFNGSREASFGSSGKLVAVGTPEDELKTPWTPAWRSMRSHDEGAEDGEKKMGLRRSLSRKLSERWGGKDSERAQPDNTQGSTSGGVGEFPQEEARRPKRPTSSRKAKVQRLPTGGTDSSSNYQSGWPQEPDDGEGRVWEEDVGDWAIGHIHGREISEPSSPSRLWKLVKRFSSGNLKEKHSPPLEAPPPVPPLPRELTFTRRTGSGDAGGGPDSGEMQISQTAGLETTSGIMRYITSMPALSIPRAKATAQARQPSAHRRATLGSSAPAGPSTSDVSTRGSHHSGPRRSTTTRSSSPSSENTKLFSRSRTSSDSSYGETVPPMPTTHMGQHIVPPHELYRLANAKPEEDITSPPSTSYKPTIPATPVSPSSSSASTTIPKFEVQNASNKFASYKDRQSLNAPTSSTSHLPDVEPFTVRAEQAVLPRPRPPPIPSRSPRRPSSISAPSLPLSIGQQSLPGIIPVQESSESETTDVDAPRRRPSSTKTPTAPKARPRSISDGAVVPESARSPNTARSPLTFREMTATKRPLTEQEKNAKWEDLLQRSDMAGGTLHVGSPAAGGLALWSDRASLAPSETLDRF